MKPVNLVVLTALCSVPVLLLIGAASGAKPSHPVARGEYLVHLGGCHDCHTPKILGAHGPEDDSSRLLSGHPAETVLPAPELRPGPWVAATAGMTAWAGPWGVSYAANLTPDEHTGLGIWTEEMFISAMRTGKHMGAGRQILPPMPWQNYARMTDQDLKAVFAYLRSIPPVRNPVPAPVPADGEASFE